MFFLFLRWSRRLPVCIAHIIAAVSLAMLTISSFFIRKFPFHMPVHLIHPYSPKLIYLNFQPLEVVSRYRDPQLQVAENYSYLFNLSTNICKLSCLDTHFIPSNGDLVD